MYCVLSLQVFNQILQLSSTWRQSGVALKWNKMQAVAWFISEFSVFMYELRELHITDIILVLM